MGAWLDEFKYEIKWKIYSLCKIGHLFLPRPEQILESFDLPR